MGKNPDLDGFMEQFPREGLTFDDVSLVTRYADFLPQETVIESRLTSRTDVHIPFVSAAMDTVTESDMAIEMAMLGGIGVIHKNLSAEEQARQVGTVKHHLHGLILNPVAFHAGDTIQTILDEKEESGFTFCGFPILDDQDKLVGILTASDIKFCRDTRTKVDDVMTRKLITASPGTSLQEAYEMMIEHRVGKLPLLEDGKLAGLYSFTDAKTLIENAAPLYNRDAKYRLRVAAAVGPYDYERVALLADADVDVVVVDSAHGHTKGIIEMVRWLAANHADIDVIAGNVATPDGALALRDAGAHAVKVGIGPGSICTTRVVCGVGVPQITAIHDTARALEGSLPVIADGGVRNSGDVPKALAAGADTVMLGSILAGTEESPGEKIIHQGRQYVVYRGMGSVAAMREGQGSRERYNQDSQGHDDLVPQGIEGIVPYAGSVRKVMTQYCGGLRSALGYSGCRSIGELQEKGRFVRVTLAGLNEAHPHDVKIMREAPNYRS